MLTKEECLNSLQCLIDMDETKEEILKSIYYLEILIDIYFELIEKPIPKKPIKYPSFASGYKCPNCESNIVLHGSHEICPTPCCSWCGQALDWSEEDD